MKQNLKKKAQLAIQSVGDFFEVYINEKNVPKEADLSDEKKNISSDQEETQSVGHGKHQIHKPAYLKNYLLLAHYHLPDLYASAMASDHSNWENAMDEEMASLAENKIWILVYLPPGEKLLSNCWVLRVKTKADGNIDRYKARLVAKGYCQKLV